MDLVKPEPLIIDGRPHYTLTSYEAPTVVVDVPSVTEEDIDRGLFMSCLQLGARPESLADDAWVAENFPGVANERELREEIRAQMKEFNTQMAEEQKEVACAAELAKRLEQRVPAEVVAQNRRDLAASFNDEIDAAREAGLAPSDVYAQMGMSERDVEAMLDMRAQEIAERGAAVLAWAEHEKITVEDWEITPLVGIMPSDEEEVLAEVRAAGRFDELRELALQRKAMLEIKSQCHCTYRHESTAAEKYPHLKLV